MKTIPPVLLLALCAAAAAHESAPEPLLFYNFTRKHLITPEAPAAAQPPAPPAAVDAPPAADPLPGPPVEAPRLRSQFGPDLLLGGAPLAGEDGDKGLRFAKLPRPHALDAAPDQAATFRPVSAFTLSAWFTIDEPQPYGALYSCIADDGGREAGLAVGYCGTRPAVALATRGADDGDGKLTYLLGERRLIPGTWHHVAATYDGTELRLFLDGEPAAASREQNGEILWPQEAPAWIGGFADSNECFPHHGRIAQVKVYDQCANADWVAREFREGKSLRELPGELPPGAEPAVVVQPYLQWVRGNEATVMWETNFPCRGSVLFGKGPACNSVAEEPEPALIHELTLRGLEPEMLYYFKTRSASPTGSLETGVQTLQTAMKHGSPFAFVVFCDTQANPQVLKRLAEAAWNLRPNFVMIGGDLVTTGTNKRHWTEHFFPHMRPLIDHVPIFPVLGNHEQNSMHYYDYMHLPHPEYWYTFRQGGMQFFMLDSNKDMRPGSAQYRWLERELAASKALWKVAMHHHPPFSSDDDYGNDWKHPVSAMSLGDKVAKPVVTLYDQHGVDLVWCGHIHSYERTWMLRGGKPVKKGGTTYLVTGGAGGDLEQFGPYRPAFQRHVKTGHHFTYVTAFGGELDFKAYDLEGRLFDHFTMTKKEAAKR